MAHEKKPVLPLAVYTPADVGRLVKELGEVDDKMLQLGLRQGGKDKDVRLPKISRLLEQMAEANEVNLLHESHRKILLKFLENLKEEAPRLHFSFSVDPSPSFMEKLMDWLRREIHPLTLVTIGLQPTLGAGCVVRGNSRQFDLSLKEDFARKRDLLADQIKRPEEARQ